MDQNVLKPQQGSCDHVTDTMSEQHGTLKEAEVRSGTPGCQQRTNEKSAARCMGGESGGPTDR